MHNVDYHRHVVVIHVKMEAYVQYLNLIRIQIMILFVCAQINILARDVNSVSYFVELQITIIEYVLKEKLL
jgi:hypothetical protein